MATIYSDERNRRPPVMLNDFREILISTISLDIFVQLQNGSLVSQFQNKRYMSKDVDISKYKHELMYKNIDKTEESQVSFLKYSIAAYENFLTYLRDETVRIDYTFLWDIVTRPNPELFKQGLNLIIIEMVNDDITNKVNLLCPTNHYQHPLFDPERDSVILYKNGNIYDVITWFRRTLTKTGYKLEMRKRFSKYSEETKELYGILKTIQSITERQCAPFSSKSSTYQFLSNVSAGKLEDLLDSIQMECQYKVMNYQGKIVALMVRYNKKDFYLPCFPSTSSDLASMPTKWIDDELWNDYHSTVDFLKHVHESSSKKLPCNPVFRVLEDDMVVGILTKTNQFVQIDPPIQNIKFGDGLKNLNGSNYIASDRTLSKTQSEQSPYQNKTVQMIYLENQFYNAFRTTLRILIRLFKNRKLRENMLTICNKEFMTYHSKHKKIMDILKTIGYNYVAFQPYSEEVLLEMQQIYSCQTNPENKKYCIVQESEGDNKYNILLLPSKHLLTTEDNAILYYGRLADELIRHRRIHLFMFYPDQYLNIGSQDYQINENEFIIPRSLLNTDYLSKLDRPIFGNHAQNVPYEHAEPSKDMKKNEALNWIEEYEKGNKRSP